MRFANSSCLRLPGVRQGGALGKKAVVPGAGREETVAFVLSVCHPECNETPKNRKRCSVGLHPVVGLLACFLLTTGKSLWLLEVRLEKPPVYRMMWKLFCRNSMVNR